MSFIFKLLILVLCYSIVKQLIFVYQRSKHLDEETIELFMLNELTKSEKERMIAHLGICRKCQSLMEEVNNFEPSDQL